MRVIEVSSFGDPEVMQIQDREIPAALPGTVVVRLHAIGVNPVETYIRAGTYPVLPDLPYIPGSNGAGIVHDIGEDVDLFRPGQRVYVAARSGTYAEYCCCAVRDIHPLPDNISFEEGAALGVPAATAYRALFMRGAGRKGEKVLIHGASGSVGLCAIQLGVAAGMEIVGTAGSDKGMRLVREHGAYPITHNGHTIKQLHEAAPDGYDLILEMLANKNLETDLEVIAPRGRIVIIGSRGRIEIDPRATMGREVDIRGLALANSTPGELQQIHEGLSKALAAGSLKPVISETMRLEEAPRAHHKVMAPGNCGKIVLIP
ncbi:NADPH:quinone reductase [Desulfopila sp. IMCC35008]|uniref:NADPH:quinone reductase n=1 Tax=Desulfopila sp. IMCC35008 TaxID=2653858 RepID=UPI0013D07EB1|nr:NADPH:quinone reductase [Desulfopila sp. IMCC35008]